MNGLGPSRLDGACCRPPLFSRFSRNNRLQIEAHAQEESDAGGGRAGQAVEILDLRDAVRDFDQAQAPVLREEQERDVGVRRELLGFRPCCNWIYSEGLATAGSPMVRTTIAVSRIGSPPGALDQ